jgi:LacI family transcriptional regulator
MFIGLSQAANYAGFSYYLYNLAEHEIENIIEQLKANRVDGILLAYNSEDIPASAVTVLLSLATPVVFMDNIPTETEKREIYSVLSDDWQGGFMCASALLTKGHRKVVYILPEHAQYTQQRRAEGFLSAFSHFESAQVQLFRCQTGIEQELEPFLAAHPDCTAIACPSDGMVVECYRVLDKLGIEYPTEMSLVGYNDIFYSAREKVPIATVRQPFYDMGRAGSKMMIEHLEKGTPMKNISFDVEFIERMSVARAVERKSGL